MSELLDNAIRYAKMGWYVFPTREEASAPFISRDTGELVVLPAKSPYYAHGFKIATTDIDTIRGWWSEHPQAGIGISCEPSHLVVVDIDTKDGRKGFENFANTGISSDGAFISTTPSGGMHIIFSGNTNSYANKLTGVDIRSNGAYIVAPPSFIIVDGKPKRYVALNEWVGSPANITDSMIEKLNLLRGRTERKSERVVETKATLSDIKRALNKLPDEYCDEYFKWVSVGMALKTIGEEGFCLWDEWSKKSPKYKAETMRYKWDKFEPNNITIGSLFYYAYGEPNGKK